MTIPNGAKRSIAKQMGGQSFLARQALAPRLRRLFLAIFAPVFFVLSMLPLYGPWITKAQAMAPKPISPLASQTQRITTPRTDGVTDAAKATAVPAEDPVTAYMRDTANKAKDSKNARPILQSEVKQKRTAFSNTYLNTEGGETERIYTEPINYKSNGGKGSWEPIVGKISKDVAYNQSESKKESLLSRILPGKPYIKQGVRQDAGLVRSLFKPLGDNDKITIGFDGTTSFDVSLLNTNTQVNPVEGTFDDGLQYVLYENAWKNTDVYYEQRGTSLKETMVIKSKDAPNSFTFSYSEATLSYGTDKNGIKDGTILVDLKDGNRIVVPQLTVVSKVKGPLQNPTMRYELDGSKLQVVLDKSWFSSLSADVFPIIVDPTYDWRGVSTGIPGGDVGQFIAYDSRGYGCNSNICDVYAGSLNDGGWKNWRTMMRLPLTSVFGQNVSWANIYTERVNRPNVWNGFNGNRPYEITWAHCFGYNCFSGAPRATAWVDWAGNFDATALMQWISTNNVGDGWLMIKAVDEGDINSFKSYAGSRTYLDVNFRHWNQQSALPTLAEPAQNATVVVSRPTLKINAVSDPDGDIIKYAFHLLDSKGRVMAHSGEVDTPWWTIPDNILVDGEKYSWRAFVMERNAGNQSIVESGWRQQPEVRSFTFDLRTGKDKTQTYEEVGDVSVSLNRGNAYTGVQTHTESALGGSLGLALDYNTPDLTRYGLTGYYYNETATGRKHAITVKDPNIDMIWGTGSPYPGTMQADNFTINWQGYFIAPEDGVYKFGAGRDDRMSMSITHDGIVDQQYDFGCCGWNWSDKQVSLTKGQAYPISVWYFEAVGYAAAHLNVRLPNGTEQRVPSEWLRTLPDTTNSGTQGLSARFYSTDASNSAFAINDTTPLVFATKVPTVNSDWGTGPLVPYDIGAYVDYMIVNYSGYIIVPATGKYQIGGGSDDGLRIRIGGKEVANTWWPHGYSETWSAEMDLTAGDVLPVSVDYFEATSAARANLQWKSSTNAVATGVIPGQYLDSSAKFVPRGWNVSIDPDSNIPYEQLQAKSSGNVDLVDSDGFVHTYTWTGSGFRPPVNEGGYLLRNNDGSYTLTDTDGRVYAFSVEGLVTRVSAPVDDRNPAGLLYDYKDTSTAAYGKMPKLSRIQDGVDKDNRYAQLYYWGDTDASTVCGVPAGYTAPPNGYLCGLKTFPDNRVTKFYYNGGQLLRVEQPGGQVIDYGYLADGRLSTVRGVAANDALAYGVRANDATLMTELTYDDLFRVSKIKTPSPFGTTVPEGQVNVRPEYSFDYGSQSTKSKAAHLPSPLGYQQYIEYDNLYRTTKACNSEGLCNASQYDPAKDLMLSMTDHLGLKSTTIYDAEDRPIEQYGPAPSEYFNANRTPAAGFESKVPRTTTNYDEGINGPSVAWYDFNAANGGVLAGAPKLHTTGFPNSFPSDVFWMNTSTGSVSPVAKSASADGYGFTATATLKFATAGAHTFTVVHDDAARLYINDELKLDKWSNRSANADVIATDFSYTFEANKSYRFRFDYANANNGVMAFKVLLDANSNTTASTKPWGSIMKPGYNLQTSQKVYDAQLGDKTNTVQYDVPELGLPTSTTTSGAGISLTSKTSYEPRDTTGTGFLRKTSATLPSNNTVTKYEYYTAAEVADQPCIAGTQQIRQGGKLKSTTSLDPDGSGQLTGVVTLNVYDDTGRVVATKTGNAPWSCSEYDDRGRVVKTITANDGARQGRTVTTQYLVNGNPFVQTVNDSATGQVQVEMDLWGRALKQTDSFGYQTMVYYDAAGRVTKRQSLKGTETAQFDGYGRATSYLLDGVTYATMTYDSYGRVSTVNYPAATNGTSTLKLSQIKRDLSKQNTGATYTFSDGTTYDETVTRTEQNGLVTGSTVTQGGKTATSSYQYDGVGRLVNAAVDNWRYAYAFGAQAAACAATPNNSAAASNNGNRTQYSVTNAQTNTTTATYNCYNAADQLTLSSDSQVGTPVYDAYGNVTQLNGGGVPIVFAYNASGQNISITQGGNKVEYTKDASGNVLGKKEYRAGQLDKVYRYASGVLLTCQTANQSQCAITDRYIALPGAVVMTLVSTSPTASETKYSIQNFHGDSAMTVGSNGLPTSSVSLYDPFGGTVNSATFGTTAAPANASDNRMGWATSPVRKQESMFTLAVMQMGARVYVPSLGRFLQVDPVEGGTPNAYAYVLDPINFADYSGQWGIPKWVKVAAIVVVVAVVVVGVVAACIAVCAAVGAAVASAGAMVAATAARIGVQIAASALVTRAAPAISNAFTKASKGVNVVSKGTKAAADATAKATAPARLTSPPAQTVVNVAKADPLAGTQYTQKALNQMSNAGDKYHSFPRLVDNFAKYGKIEKIVGGDKTPRTRVTIEGSLNGKDGIFEYIIEPNNMINHRLFIPF